MKLTLISSCLIILLIRCQANKLDIRERTLPEHMQYSFGCLSGTTTSNVLSPYLEKADSYLSNLISSEIIITDMEQMEAGEDFLNKAKSDQNFIINSADHLNIKLQSILMNLLKSRDSASAIKYKIFLWEDQQINAFTIGGNIFVSRGMINKCKSDDQLYSIIGHEIGHNEKGHIRDALAEIKAGKKYLGDLVEPILSIKHLLTMSFSQKKELEADYYGVDLTWKLGYDVCAIKTFWEEMSKSDKHNAFEDLFRSHPYSDVRGACLREHIETNFNQICN